MSNHAAWQEMGAVLKDLSDARVRELCIAALRLLRADPQQGKRTTFRMAEDFGAEVVKTLLKQRPDLRLQHVSDLKWTFVHGIHQPWMTPVVEFFDWFIRAGLAFPFPFGADKFRLTRAGQSFLGRDSDHPLMPGHVERIRGRCPGLSDSVVALLVDSQTCLEHMLLRPAVVVMGVAFESAVEGVADSLVSAGKLAAGAADAPAARRIASVRDIAKALPEKSSAEKDHRFAVLAAYEFADQLRRRRNDAAHTAPRYGFDDYAEVEELLVSAGRHLPPLWSLAATPP